MEPTNPRFIIVDPDKPFQSIHSKIISTRVEGKWYVFYKHQDGSTKLMLREQYYQFIDHGLIPEPGKPEDVPGLT
jgi:hypothetical protein